MFPSSLAHEPLQLAFIRAGFTIPKRRSQPDGLHDLGPDVNHAVRAKLKKNETKYPVEKSRGNAKQYDE